MFALSSTGARIGCYADVHDFADADGVCYAKVVDRDAAAQTQTVLTVRFSTHSAEFERRFRIASAKGS